MRIEQNIARPHLFLIERANRLPVWRDDCDVLGQRIARLILAA